MERFAGSDEVPGTGSEEKQRSIGTDERDSPIAESEASGWLIDIYAIGGAVAAVYYLEPFATVDLDVFVALSPPAGSSLLSLTPIYEYLTLRGARLESEYIIVGNWPVQFLPASDALEIEALREARDVDVDGTPTRVLRAEHLVALALRTGRPKDHSRIVQFISEKVVDTAKMNDIFDKHGLSLKWQTFEKRYFGG